MLGLTSKQGQIWGNKEQRYYFAKKKHNGLPLFAFIFDAASLVRPQIFGGVKMRLILGNVCPIWGPNNFFNRTKRKFATKLSIPVVKCAKNSNFSHTLLNIKITNFYAFVLSIIFPFFPRYLQ